MIGFFDSSDPDHDPKPKKNIPLALDLWNNQTLNIKKRTPEKKQTTNISLCESRSQI